MVLRNRKIDFYFSGLIMCLFFLPYMGNACNGLFVKFGKLYYACAIALCLVVLVLRAISKYSYKNPYKNITVYPVYKMTDKLSGGLMLLFIYLAVSLLLSLNNFENVAFIFLLVCFFVFVVDTYRLHDRYFFEFVGEIAVFFYAFFIVIHLFEKKFSYFNPNSYALISTVLYLFSSLYLNKFKNIRMILIFFLFLITVYFVYFLYKSETQLLTVTFFTFVIFIDNCITFRKKILYVIMVTGLFLFAFLLPFITYKFIQMGILDYSFISDRGQRWTDSINALKGAGIFGISKEVQPSHNGFLDTVLKYSLVLTLFIFFFMYRLIIKSYHFYKKDKKFRVLTMVFLSFFVMNSCESIFVGLTDSYFMIFVYGTIYSYLIKNDLNNLGIYKNEKE